MSKTLRPQNSYISLVAQAANKQAAEVIQPMVVQKVAEVAGIVQNNLKQYISHTLSKTVVLEKLLIAKGVLTVEEIATGVMDHEDSAWGLETASDEAKESDTLRLVIKKKPEGADDFALPYNVMIPSLGSGQSELGKDLEESLKGLKAGDSKDAADAENKVTLNIFVTRVSRRKA